MQESPDQAGGHRGAADFVEDHQGEGERAKS
jgi:hypothetical protein